MPPSPRNSPGLKPAAAADSHRPRSGYVSCRETWSCYFGAGDWRPVRIEAWWLDDDGRWVVLLYWAAEGDQWSGAFLDDTDRLVDPDPGEPSAAPADRRGG